MICIDYGSEDEHEKKIIKKQKTVSDNMEHIMLFQEELKEWKQKYTELEIKYKDLKDRYFKVLDLNVKWQEKELSHHSSHRSSHKSENVTKHKNAKHDSCKYYICFFIIFSYFDYVPSILLIIYNFFLLLYKIFSCLILIIYFCF